MPDIMAYLIVNATNQAFDSAEIEQYLNTSWNSSALCVNAQGGYTTAERITMCVYNALVFFLGFVGNFLVILVLGQKRLRRGADVYILSLAAADMIASCTGPPIVFLRMSGLKISRIVWTPLWNTGKYLISATLVTSSFMLTVIAFDRFRAITKPIVARRVTKRRKMTACLFVWIFGCSFSSLFMMNKKEKTKQFEIIQLILCAIGWVIPWCLTSILYIKCAIALWSRKIPSNSAAERRVKETRDITKMFLLVIFVFFVLTIPTNAKYVVDALKFLLSTSTTTTCQTIDLVTRILNVASFMNGCVNPLIYARVHPDIKGFLKRSKSSKHRISMEPRLKNFKVKGDIATLSSEAN